MARVTPQRYTDIERVVDGLMPGYERAVLRIIAQGPGDPGVQARVVDLLRRGRTEEALNLAVTSFAERAGRIGGDLAKGRAAAMAGASRVTGRGSAFPATWEAAVEHAQTAADKSVQNFVKQAWSTGGEALRRSLEEGWSGPETGRRLATSLGVGQHRMGQILKKRDEGKLKGRALDAAMRKAIRHRANTVARTALIDAANTGQDMAWRKAGSEGRLNLREMERVWTVGYDERLCPICSPLAGKSAGMDEAFEGGFFRPPAHAQCRCSLGLRRKKNALPQHLRTQAREAARIAPPTTAAVTVPPTPIPPVAPPVSTPRGTALREGDTEASSRVVGERMGGILAALKEAERTEQNVLKRVPLRPNANREARDYLLSLRVPRPGIGVKGDTSDSRMKEANGFISRIDRTEIPTAPDAVYFKSTERQRAYWGEVSGNVHINRRERAGTIIHEYFHAVEDRNKQLSDAAHAFRDRRKAPGEKLQRLKDLLPNSGYGDNEMTYPSVGGKVAGVYAGKHYSERWTEIVSMGTETLHSRPLDFFERDRDYFDFILKNVMGVGDDG